MKRILVVSGTLMLAVLSAPYAAQADSPAPERVVAKNYKNCTALNKVYKHGVGRLHARDHVSSGKPVTNFTRNNALYQANKGKDRDGDKVACEKK